MARMCSRDRRHPAAAFRPPCPCAPSAADALCSLNSTAWVPRSGASPSVAVLGGRSFGCSTWYGIELMRCHVVQVIREGSICAGSVPMTMQCGRDALDWQLLTTRPLEVPPPGEGAAAGPSVARLAT